MEPSQGRIEAASSLVVPQTPPPTAPAHAAAAESPTPDAFALADRPPQTLGRRPLQITEDPRIASGELSVHTLFVERFEQPQRRLAQRRGLADQHGHRLPRAPLPEQRAADRVVGAGREVGELLPERGAIVGERLLGGLALGGRAATATERHLPLLRERLVRL